jgi:hypothetical protein
MSDGHEFSEFSRAPLIPPPWALEAGCACTAEALCNLKVNKSKSTMINKPNQPNETMGIVFEAAK